MLFFLCILPTPFGIVNGNENSNNHQQDFAAGIYSAPGPSILVQEAPSHCSKDANHDDQLKKDSVRCLIGWVLLILRRRSLFLLFVLDFLVFPPQSYSKPGEEDNSNGDDDLRTCHTVGLNRAEGCKLVESAQGSPHFGVWKAQTFF